MTRPVRADLPLRRAAAQARAAQTIVSAALDVWYRYPGAPGATLPACRPFHELSNALTTPHVSGWTEGMLDARAARAIPYDDGS